MRMMLLLPVALYAAGPVQAQDISGSWRVQTKDVGAGRGCTLEGALQIRPAGEPMACELTLVQQCARQKGKYLLVRESCAITRTGAEVEIKGTSYEIVEAKPPGAWSRYYKLDTFEVTVQPDGQSMTGIFKGMAHTRATFTRMQDLAE